jgi:hypothetical protein
LSNSRKESVKVIIKQFCRDGIKLTRLNKETINVDFTLIVSDVDFLPHGDYGVRILSDAVTKLTKIKIQLWYENLGTMLGWCLSGMYSALYAKRGQLK